MWRRSTDIHNEFFANQLVNRLVAFWQFIRRLQSYSNFLWVYAGEFNQIIFYEVRNCDDMRRFFRNFFIDPFVNLLLNPENDRIFIRIFKPDSGQILHRSNNWTGIIPNRLLNHRKMN